MKRLVLSIAGFSLAGFLACSAAHAAGYDGLIPDNSDGAKSAPSGNGGYAGVVAPPSEPEDNGKDAPQGYSGLMPGKTAAPQAGLDAYPNAPKPAPKAAAAKSPAGMDPSKAVGGFSPIDTLPKMSVPKGVDAQHHPLTVQQLKTLSALGAKGIDFNHITPQLAKALKLPEDAADTLAKVQRPRIDGMLPAEFTAKRTIDALMANVQKAPEGDTRKKMAQAAYDRLSSMADGYRTLGSVPDGIYKTMGVSDTYVKEEREGYGKATDRIHDALQTLDTLRK